VALALTRLENHRTRTEFEDALIVKSFSFQFINYYFLLFYLGFLKTGYFPTTRLEDHCTLTAGGDRPDCIADLHTQLMYYSGPPP
jgi:hypothetical protein